MIARRRDSFLTMRKVFVPRTMVPPEFQVVVQAVRNGFATPIVDPESRIAASAQRVVQFQEIDNPLPSAAIGVFEYPHSLRHSASATRQQICNGLRRQLDHYNGGGLPRLQ